MGGADDCSNNSFSLANITLQQEGSSQTEKFNFDNTITLYTKNIKVNDIETKYATSIANGIPSENYLNVYHTLDNILGVRFFLQITKLVFTDKDKIKETYLQAYYTNDLKLKIRFTKVLLPILQCFYVDFYAKPKYWGNIKDITLDVSNPNVLGIRNKSDNPIRITFKPN